MESILLLVTAGVAALAASLVKMPWFSKKVKVMLATIVSVVAATVYTYTTGDFQGFADIQLLEVTAQVFGLSQAVYFFILDGTKVDEVLENVGVKTEYDDDAL